SGRKHESRERRSQRTRMSAEGIQPFDSHRLLDLLLELESLNADRSAVLQLGTMVDDGLGGRDRLPIPRRAATPRVEIDRALTNGAGLHIHDLRVLPVVLKLGNIALRPLI